MLVEESIWIGNKINDVLHCFPFPVLNIGSSTKEYRTVIQPFIQKNIFDKFADEQKNVIHVDSKKAEGVDIVGNLYDEEFFRKLKSYRPGLILCNNTLMYLNKPLREKLAEIFYEILTEGGYLIITNSFIFPPSPDPVEEYYRKAPLEIYKTLFSKFNLIEQKIVETNYSYYKLFKSKNYKFKVVKAITFFLPFYKFRQWKFMLKYYLFNFRKKYSASCLFLQK